MVCADVAQEIELAPAINQANRAIARALKLPRAQTANDLLDKPHDTSALDAYVAEKVTEAMK